MTKEESLRISSEINISGACVANKGQLINTCKGQESQTGEKLGSNEPIKLEKIYYLGTTISIEPAGSRKNGRRGLNIFEIQKRLILAEQCY